MKKKLLLILGLTAFFASNLKAQLNYLAANAQNFSGIYTDLGTNGTAVTLSNFDDANSTAQSIGFTFNFNGTAFTDFVINTNGFIKLGNTTPSVAGLYFTTQNGTAGGPFASASTADVNILAAFNHDIDGGTSPEIRVHTSGAVGSQVCTIQWKNFKDKNTIAQQANSINFQIKLYETSNVIEFIYGTWTPSANTSAFKSATVGIKGNSTAANQIVTITKGSVTPFGDAIIQSGNYPAATNAFNWGNPPARPFPDAGRTYRFLPTYTVDAQVLQVYTLGKMAIPYANPHRIEAVIRNAGSQILNNITATLNISGANTFTNAKTISTISIGGQTTISFDNFSPTVQGLNTITVTCSVTGDLNPSNDSQSRTMEANQNAYSYSQGSNAAGGVGFANATGDFVAKFKTNQIQALNQVNVNFNAGGQPFKIGIWDQNATTKAPGTLLYETTTYTSTLGIYTVPINPALNVNGEFFVGVRQVGTTNVAFGYQNESPIRDSTMYYTSPTGGTVWTDFALSAAPGTPFRFMVEPRFALSNDLSVSSANPASGATIAVGQSTDITAGIINYGSLAQNSAPIFYSVNGGAPIGPVNTGSLAFNASGNVTFTGSNAFTTATQGAYTLKIFSQLSGDQNLTNDTLTINYVALNPISTLPYSQNFNTPVAGFQVQGSANLWNATAAVQADGTNGSVFFADYFNTVIGTAANLVTPIFNFSGINSPIMKFDVAYRTFNTETDTLKILVSTDGGVTFQSGFPELYNKTINNGLPTLSPSTANYTPTASGEWRQETVDLSQFGNLNNVMIAFRGISNSGNNCFIDNLLIYALGPPALITTSVSNITTTSADIGGDVTSDGGQNVTERGICYATTQAPTIANALVQSGSGLGTFSVSLSGLQPGTTYYARAYATNAQGTSYGNEITFTTNALLATVTTNQVSAIGSFFANISGNVTNTGGGIVSKRGICYATSPNPTTVNDTAAAATGGAGNFIINLTGLTGGTIYYARAFAENQAGIAYGNEVTFTTSAPTAPSLVTTVASGITNVSAVSGGTINNNGGAAITAAGTCWDVNQNPTTASQFTVDAISGNSFSSILAGLTANTSYFARAYATNSAGTSYGNQISFTTALTSINSIDNQNSIKLYNINSTIFINGMNDNSILENLKIFDLNGKEVFNWNGKLFGNSISIQTTDLPTSIYIVRLGLNNELLEAKILLQ